MLKLSKQWAQGTVFKNGTVNFPYFRDYKLIEGLKIAGLIPYQERA
jgi:hypothetical protein